MRVAFGTLKIGETAKRNLNQVIETNWASAGPLVKQFENNWTEKFGYADSVSMSSGTDADINACLVLYDRGAKRDDEVICPALTFVATVNSVLMAGFIPTFADIDRNTLNIDPQKIKDAITDKTRAIMVTHTMGKPCDMDAIMSIANDHDLFVIEDACLVPGQKIITNLGLKNIEDVQEGDRVYTHKGRFSSVLNTMNRNYNGDIIDIYTYGQDVHLKITTEHPVLVVKTEDILATQTRAWVTAQQIKRGDYLVLPRYSHVDDKDYYDLSSYDHRSSNTKCQSLFESRYKEKISVNSDLMIVVGWYLAKGWCHRQYIEFSLSKDEVDNINDLCHCIESLDLDYEIQDQNASNECVNICIFSKQFKSFLGENFGNGAKNKRIPAWVLDLSSSKLEALLAAYIKGDGNKVKDREEQYSVTSISLDLLQSIRIICSKLGYCASITQSAKAGIGKICGRIVNVADKYQLRFSKKRLNEIDRRTYIDDDYIYYRVRSIENQKYVGKVFNLEVNNDNSYCGVGWAMHNCEAHGAQYKGQHIGKFGHVATFSYYVAHIVVCGEGGMCSTQYPEVAEILRSTKSHGRRPRTIYFNFLRMGINSKMNDLEAAIGLEGLEQFDSTIESRIVNRTKIMAALDDLQDEIWLPNLGTGDEFVSPHAFPIVFKKDDPERCSAFYKFLEDNSIQCKTLFGSMPTQHDAFKTLGYKLGDFPEAEFVGNNGVHFGIHQYLTEEDVDYIVNKVKDFIGDN